MKRRSRELKVDLALPTSYANICTVMYSTVNMFTENVLKTGVFSSPLLTVINSFWPEGKLKF